MKKLSILMLGLSVVLMSNHATADHRFVQAASCPNSYSYACCMKDEWETVLWVPTADKVNSAKEVSDACADIDADSNKSLDDDFCAYNTSIFNQSPEKRISSKCDINNYMPNDDENL